MSGKKKTCEECNCSFFKLSFLEDLEKSTIKLNSSLITFNKGDIIYKQEVPVSHIMIVRSGLVRVNIDGHKGKTFILKLAVEGNYLGLLSAYGGGTYHTSATAVEKSEICFIELDKFNQLLELNPEFSKHIIGTTCNEGLFGYDRLMNLTQKQLPGRIASMLYYFSKKVYNSERFEIPLSRRELAYLVGTSKESCIRTLMEFKNDKIINVDGKLIEIVSMPLIERLRIIG